MYTLVYQELDYVDQRNYYSSQGELCSTDSVLIWQPKISESYHTVEQLESLFKSLEGKTIKIWSVGF